ncbi:MAG TPA: hypothetical protein VKV17_07175 [Bryobacteraceae bacterium]|nr:hypothetical protein [Bryobacteraceae bacterium]
MRLFRLLSIAGSAAAILFAAGERSFTTWTEYLGGADSSQYSALRQINKSNVSQLRIAWTYPAGEKHRYLSIPS